MEAYSEWRRRTAGGIRYKLIEGPRFEIDLDNPPRAFEKYIIRAQDLDDFYVESFTPTNPYTRRMMPGSDTYFTEKLTYTPLHDNQKPADPLAVDPTAPDGTYEKFYVADIEYKGGIDRSSTTDPEVFLERSVSMGIDLITVDSTKTDTGSGEAGAEPADVDENHDDTAPYTKACPVIDMTASWKFVINPNWARFASYIGCVNKAAHALFLNSEPDTVLFSGVSGRQLFLYKAGAWTVQPWSLDFQFSIKRITEVGKVYGWNHIWSKEKQAWRFLLRNTSELLYPRKDLTKIFM